MSTYGQQYGQPQPSQPYRPQQPYGQQQYGQPSQPQQQPYQPPPPPYRPEPRPTKPPKRRVHPALIATVLGLVVILIAVIIAIAAGGGDKADPSKLDDAGRWACDDFAKGYPTAKTPALRTELARTVNKNAASSKTNMIADLGTDLSHAATGSDGAWKIAADGFAARCMDAGWKAN